jgi:hypothetical protein
MVVGRTGRPAYCHLGGHAFSVVGLEAGVASQAGACAECCVALGEFLNGGAPVRQAGKPKGDRMATKTIGVVGNEATRKKLAGISKKPIAIVGNDAVKAKLVDMAKTGRSDATLKGTVADQGGRKVLVLADGGSKRR